MLRKMRVSSVLFLLLLPAASEAGDILMWMDFGGKSHLIVWKPLALELARRGHHVTFVGPFADRDLSSNPNITYDSIDIDVDRFLNATDVFLGNYPSDILSGMFTITAEIQQIAFRLPLVQDMIERKPHFDVSIFSPVTNDIGMYMAKEYFRSPVIMYFFALKWPLMDIALYNPTNPSYIPSEYINLGQSMSFLQRVGNTMLRMFLPAFDKYRTNHLARGVQEILKLDEMPDLVSMTYDIDFGFFNSHHIFDGVRPMGPNSADIGGIHLRPAREIEDEELRAWLDGARDGFVYVSYGTILSSSAMPEEKLRHLLEAFSGLGKVRVLWKWEKEQMEAKPSNVMLKKWLPQQDVLGHPNCRLFVTHGGLMSAYESINHGVPMIVMPGFADQYSNAARAVREGYGRTIHWADLDHRELLSAMLSVLPPTSPYSLRASQLSSVLRDHLAHPLERAAYHVEYVMRHAGARHLRSPAEDLYWFQYFLLDVALFLVMTTLLILCLLYGLCLCLWRCLFGKKRKRKAVEDARKKRE